MASLDSEIRVDSQSLESSQLLTPVDKASLVPPKIISVSCGSVFGELSFILINCLTKALPNLVVSSVYCLIRHGILSLNSNLLVAKPSLKTGVNQSLLLIVTSNLVLFSNLLDLLVLRPLLLLHLVMLVLLLLDPSIHNPGL